MRYTKWDKHGEKDKQATTAQIHVNAITEFVDDTDFDLDFGSKIPTVGPVTVEMVNATKESFDKDDLAKFQELLLDAEKTLYKGCPDFIKLSSIVKLLNVKGKYGAFDKFFTELLGLLKKLLPDEKDRMNARLDLAELGIKPEFFARQEEDKTTLPPTGYTLTNTKKDIFCEMLSNIRVTQGYCSKFSSLVSLKDMKLTGLKSHDYHMLMQEFLPIAIRLIMHPPTRYAIIRREKKAFNGQQEFQLALNPLTGEQIYNEATQASFKNQNSGKRIALLENEHNKSVAKWLCDEVERELAISKDSVSETISNNGIVYQKSGVSVEVVDLHISKEVATTGKTFYYRVLQEIWVLDYHFRQIPLFKGYWVNHKASGVKHNPNLGYSLVDLNSLGHKDDLSILASQARQVFYVKDQIDKKLSIVFRTPTKNYKDKYNKVDEELSTVIYEHNDNILPRVNQRDLGNESQNDYYRTDCEVKVNVAGVKVTTASTKLLLLEEKLKLLGRIQLKICME
nr:hypothetical protein [Tanacetum cinerariifolium]